MMYDEWREIRDLIDKSFEGNGEHFVELTLLDTKVTHRPYIIDDEDEKSRKGIVKYDDINIMLEARVVVY